MNNVLKTIGLLGLMALPVLAQGSKEPVKAKESNKVVATNKVDTKKEVKPAVVAEAPMAATDGGTATPAPSGGGKKKTPPPAPAK